MPERTLGATHTGRYAESPKGVDCGEHSIPYKGVETHPSSDVLKTLSKSPKGKA